jgi:hypothetical protein
MGKGLWVMQKHNGVLDLSSLVLNSKHKCLGLHGLIRRRPRIPRNLQLQQGAWPSTCLTCRGKVWCLS